MIHKKIAFAVPILLALAIAFSGCSKNEKETEYVEQEALEDTVVSQNSKEGDSFESDEDSATDKSDINSEDIGETTKAEGADKSDDSDVDADNQSGSTTGSTTDNNESDIVITTDQVRVRKGPSLEADTYTLADVGETFTRIAIEGEWSKGQYDGGEYYTFSEYLMPADQTTETQDQEAYYGYTSLADAVAQIQALELELSSVQSSNTTYVEEIEQLKAEVQRLQTFESQQVEFQRIKTEFYEEVIYAENGPGPEAYKEYFESIDPTTAEYLYQQVVQNLETDSQMSDYAQGYAKMDPSAAAKIFDNMPNNLDLVAEILWAMDASSRGNILANMDPEIAAQVTTLMDP